MSRGRPADSGAPRGVHGERHCWGATAFTPIGSTATAGGVAFTYDVRAVAGADGGDDRGRGCALVHWRQHSQRHRSC
ncbi:MAG: hypothetical protein GY750_14155 [Lentisphaerae bacterium]|nr:hypothetical protein [Lentisphaerota bacterium]